ncbi:DUF4268 domain-containing protein [Comamonas kerstersii]|uniref:DUF4268 domain-containing protein n=1 Tax=Comamonas kerstersii TaxID=225992 RepID=UPI00266DB855|nr:DUF4268 domain-containing protein [Comamonas kerstersii]
MYKVNIHLNRVEKIKRSSFQELKFSERNHLQEWIEKQPDIFGEELLIIQKEFDGFDETKERLDLLALDKGGNLVIIENKLDDSGRDVVWQSIKYASYCSALSKTNILEIYQKYLSKQNIQQDAKKNICDFFDKEEFDSVVLNNGSMQRIIMVAANFRKEVTSTVLWLMKHGVNIKCFKTTPFKNNDEIYLSVEQIIPLPEAEELMIGIAEKERQETDTELGNVKRENLRKEFWQHTLEFFNKNNLDIYKGVSPSKDHWLNTGAGISGVHYSLIFLKDEIRVEFALDTGSKNSNKSMFDYLFSKKDEIENTFKESLVWKKLEDKKVSLIQFSKSIDADNKENWNEMADWMMKNIQNMKNTFSKYTGELRVINQNSN